MKKLVIFLLLSLVHVARAQDGNIPTLDSKMLKGEITMIEYFQFKNDPEAKEYMQRTQVSREYYDNTGKLIKKEDEGGGKKLRAEYIPNKKGKLKEVRHVDLFTGDVFKTIVYTYKKGNLFSIAEKTDGVTTKVELKRNKKGDARGIPADVELLAVVGPIGIVRARRGGAIGGTVASAQRGRASGAGEAVEGHVFGAGAQRQYTTNPRRRRGPPSPSHGGSICRCVGGIQR